MDCSIRGRTERFSPRFPPYVTKQLRDEKKHEWKMGHFRDSIYILHNEGQSGARQLQNTRVISGNDVFSESCSRRDLKKKTKKRSVFHNLSFSKKRSSCQSQRPRLLSAVDTEKEMSWSERKFYRWLAGIKVWFSLDIAHVAKVKPFKTRSYFQGQ